MKQNSLFCFFFHVEISQTMALHAMFLVSSKKLSMGRVAQTSFEIVWSYVVETINY
jgi:hypothetical protein